MSDTFLTAILSTDTTKHRAQLLPHVRQRVSFDSFKVLVYASLISELADLPYDQRLAAMYNVNHHLNLHIKPVHAKMMTEPLSDSARSIRTNKPKGTNK